MVDSPPADKADPSSYLAAIEEFLAACPEAPTRRLVISSLPESTAEAVRERCLAAGVAPLQGQREALEALDLAGSVGAIWTGGGGGGGGVRLCRPAAPPGATIMLAEHEAKSVLAAFGVTTPRSRVVRVQDVTAAAQDIGFPVVIKASGSSLQHKSDLGGVILNVRSPHEAHSAAERLARLSDTLLVEEMVTDGVAEILVGMTVDPQFGQMLVLGAGGTLTELLRDTAALLPPFSAEGIARALRRLSIAPLLHGYRGRPAADVSALIELVLSCTRYAMAQLERLVELDLNPVIVRPQGRGAVAVDALIRLNKEH